MYSKAHIIVVALLMSVSMVVVSCEKEPFWKVCLDVPESYAYEPSVVLQDTFSFAEMDVEVLLQRNGPKTYQRVLKAFPKSCDGPLPAVVVPFYFPEAMLGFELDGSPLDKYAGVEMISHLVARGFACISADSFHLTYIESDKPRDAFSRWKEAGEALVTDYPEWCGMGKLVADTRLLIDLLVEDARIDPERIGIAGHSLGGKMAFYTGCLDRRVKAILASDFGFLWHQSNWEKPWYWGTKLDMLKMEGVSNVDILSCSDGRPFMLIAGQYDTNESYEAMKQADGYDDCPENLVFFNHGTGHRPTWESLEAGYDFLNKHLKQ